MLVDCERGGVGMVLRLGISVSNRVSKTTTFVIFSVSKD